MNARIGLLLATMAVCLSVKDVHAQGAAIAIGAAVPSGDLSGVAGAGYDIELQVKTDPMIGPLALRIDISLDHFAGKAAFSYHQVSGQSVSVTGDVGSAFYWLVGPGYYQMEDKTQIAGHNAVDHREYLGAQAALGVAIPVLRWKGFLEAGAVKLFSPGPTTVYFPLRFGVRL